MSFFNWADGRRREALPIDTRLGEILGALGNHQVVVVEAETGAGKTTRIPQAVLTGTPVESIVMTQTRRAAVRWNGKRIAQEMGCQPGGIVGWRLHGEEPKVSRDTRLTLLMEQTLINRIRRNGGRLPEGLIILDEAHERSVQTDLLLGLIREALPTSPNTWVMVMSATIDTQKFSAYFGGAPIIKVAGRCYPVSTEVVRLDKFEHHSQAAARAAGMTLGRFLKGTLEVPGRATGEKPVPVRGGTVLVLLPGKEDIKAAMAAILSSAKELGAGDRVQVMACHGELSGEEQDAVQAPVPNGVIRFVCATEVVRTSVTVPSTVGVIDSLQVKRLLTNAQGVAHLSKVTVSRAEADQAKGRAGRTAPGFYIPVSFESEYERLAPYPQPAIHREPLTKVALEVAAIGRDITTFPWIDAPPADKAQAALKRLRNVGAIDQDGRITEIGEILVKFPIDPERAKVLMTAEQLGVMPEAIVIAGVMEAEGIYFRPRDHDKVTVSGTVATWLVGSHNSRLRSWGGAPVDLTDPPTWLKPVDGGRRYEFDGASVDYRGDARLSHYAQKARQWWAGCDSSDFAAMVRAYRAFKEEEYRLRDARQAGEKVNVETGLRAWCDTFFINYKRARMAEDAMRQIRDEVMNSPLTLAGYIGEEREFNAEALTKALASGLVDHVSRRRGDGFTGPLGDFQLGRESTCSAGQELILIGGVRKVMKKRQRGTGFFHLADTAAPVKPEWLAEVMPQLCTSVRRGDHRYDPAGDVVVETEVHRFGDLKINEHVVPTRDDVAAANTFAAWLASQMVGYY